MSRPVASSEGSASVEEVLRSAPTLTPQAVALRAQVRLLEFLGSTAPLNILLEKLVAYVESWSAGLYCSVLLLEPGGRFLRPAAAPSLPAAYLQAIDPMQVAVGQGCCGTAAARREVVIVEDIERSELWTGHAATAIAHGLRACWSAPIVDPAHELLGTLAMYYPVPRAPSSNETDLIRFAAALAAFVIQRHRDSERFRASEARLDAAVAGTELGLWEYTVGSGFSWFDNWCERFDIDACPGPDAFDRWCARVHSEDVESYRRVYELCRRSGLDHYTVDYRIRTRSDHWRWVHERGRVVARTSEGVPSRYVGVCVDIDQQKQTEAALLRAEDRYELAIDAARLAVWEHDVASGAVRGNGYWHRAAGCDLTEEEARERTGTWLSNVHPEDEPRLRRILEKPAPAENGLYEVEFRLRQPNGEYRWLLDRGRVIERSATGAPLKVVGVSLDIDARKRMESILRESEERFRSAFEYAAIGMALVAPDGRWLRVNQALCRIVGYSAEELLRIDFQTITHPDDLDADLAFVRKMLDGTLSYYDMEKRYFHKTGRTIWILLSVSLVRDEQGRPQYFISQIQDITTRKQAEERLRESELRYRTTSELVAGFVFEGAVVDGVPQPTWVSDGFQRVYGCSLEDFGRLGARRFYDAETRAQLRAAAAAVARGEDLRADVRLRSVDGTQKWLRVVARAISADGRRVLGVAEDITEQNRLARALREATHQEQQRLARELHDGLGQELTGLAYLAGSLARAAADSQSAQATDLATLEKIANRTVSSCRNIARGISPLTESRGSLVQALRSLVDGVAAGGQTSIGFEAIENAPMTLPWAYREHLYRIAQEAVTNALRHSAGTRIEVRIEVDATLVRIQITDNGRGFDPRRAASEGLGFDSMRQRAAAVGARLRLTTPQGGGTMLECACPQALLTAAQQAGTTGQRGV